ncbi:hypothetical protein G6024_14710 [Dietzia maris]|nr:hypothetical protein [Dietzia maris]MBB0998322.1 hypothetical protein [Dietzia maris]
MSKSKQIKNALVTLLSGLEIDGEAAFYAVTDDTSKDFDGSPVVRVLPDFIENTKGAMSQNDREVNYQIVVHLPLENIEAIQGQQLDQIYTLTDLILDALDEGDFGNRLEEIDPSLGTYIMRATRADWDAVDSKGGALIMMVINVAVGYTKNLEDGLR